MNDDKDCFLFPTPFFKGSFVKGQDPFVKGLSESFGSSRSSTFFQKFSRQPFSKLKRRWKNLVLPHLTSRRSGVAKRWQHPPVRPCLFWDLGKELIHRKALWPLCFDRTLPWDPCGYCLCIAHNCQWRLELATQDDVHHPARQGVQSPATSLLRSVHGTTKPKALMPAGTVARDCLFTKTYGLLQNLSPFLAAILSAF